MDHRTDYQNVATSGGGLRNIFRKGHTVTPNLILCLLLAAASSITLGREQRYLRPRAALPSAEGRLLLWHLWKRLKGDGFLCWDAVCFFAVAEEVTK